MAAPTVRTDPATYISYYCATLNGYCSAIDEEAPASYIIFEYTTKADYTANGWGGSPQWTIYELALPDTSYDHYISGLTESTDYVFRIVGVESTNYSYGTEKEFTTTAQPSYYHGLKVGDEGELALCDVGTPFALRIRKGGTTYGIELVATDDANASRIYINTGVGIKALRLYT